MFDHNNPIQLGDVILYKKMPYRLIKITEENGHELYDLYNGYEEIKNVFKENIEDNPDDLFKYFRIYCGDDELDMEFNDYMYIVMTNNKNENENENGNKQDNIKYQLVQSINKPYIFTVDEIPIYIKYFIFNSCYAPDDIQLHRIGFSEPKLQDDILDFAKKRTERILKLNIDNDIVLNEEKIKKYKEKYKKLKSNKIKSLEQQLEQTRLSEHIKDLKQMRNDLKEIKSMLKSKKNISGGAINSSEQFVPQYNPLGYPLNPNYPSNVVYLPRQGYSYQKSYYPKQPNVPYNVPHNVSQNKAKDQKSKLSFYITVELELFPGKSVNALQKSVVKCQSTFERIREAWANIFGFEYRPLPMTESYDYKSKVNKTQKKNINAKNTTRKIHSDK
jgi:hypothetical protein